MYIQRGRAGVTRGYQFRDMKLMNSFPGWGPNSGQSWENAGLVNTALNNVLSINSSPSRIIIGTNGGSAANNRLRSLSRADLSTWTTHTTPFSHLGIRGGIAHPDNEGVIFYGSTNGGGSVAYKVTLPSTHVNLVWPGDSSDGIIPLAFDPFDADLMYWGNSARASSGEVELYSLRISTTTWALLAGSSANNSWQIDSNSSSLFGGLVFNDDPDPWMYALLLGGTTSLYELWRRRHSIVDGWDMVFSLPANMRDGRMVFSPGQHKLYLGAGSDTVGDGEVWVWNERTETGSKIADFTGMTRAAQVAIQGTKLAIGNRTDSDVWQYDIPTETEEQIGGDDINGSWGGTLTTVSTVHVDDDGRLWASATSGTSGTPTMYSIAAPS